MVLAKLTLAGAIAAPLELLTISAVMFFGVDDETALASLSAPAFNASLLLTWMFLAMLPGPFLLLVEALACRVMGSVHPGVISRWSPRYIRIWLKTGLLDSSSRWLYGTLIWSAWLRLAGMRVGRGCEISTLIDAIPEMVEIGDRTFCTDGLYLGGARIHRGTVMLARTRLGSNDFLGNGAIIPGGVNLPDDVLLGVCTIADPLRVRAGTSWFGHPAFLLPRREVVALNHGPTQNPSALQYLGRVFWELMRFALPAAVAVVFVVWYTLLTAAEASVPLPLLLAVIPLLTFAGIGAITGLILALKWILLGRVRPGMHPLWSSWASRWDLYCMMWSYYVGDLVFQLDGTLLLGWLLRAAGVRVGKGVLLSRQFAADLATPDMLKFEDGATVDGSFQDHTFEDRVLKMDYVTVCRNATVGRNAVLLYGSEIGVASRVAPNSVVMKNERLPAGQTYSGFPVRQQDGAGW